MPGETCHTTPSPPCLSVCLFRLHTMPCSLPKVDCRTISSRPLPMPSRGRQKVNPHPLLITKHDANWLALSPKMQNRQKKNDSRTTSGTWLARHFSKQSTPCPQQNPINRVHCALCCYCCFLDVVCFRGNHVSPKPVETQVAPSGRKETRYAHPPL